MSSTLSSPLASQIQVNFIHVRGIYEMRERPSRMYSWSALVTAQFLAELPLVITGGILFFLCWYWTVAFPNDRAGYTFLMMAIIFPTYYLSLSQTVASMAPSPEVAALLFAFFYAFVIIL
jgi:ATP-binding cassette, subfamily G (WHITE), member 2, SNQ2